MGISKQLREDIQEKFRDLSPRRVNQKIKAFGKERKITNRDIAAYAFAWDELGINIQSSKYSVDDNTLSKVQTALQSSPQVIYSKPKPPIKNNTNSPSKKIVKFIDYKTEEPFLLGHINEVNICYTHHAYTAAFILCRKIMENLLIEIIIKKFPNKKDNLDIYFDKSNNRNLDFSVILKNLRTKINEFGPDKSLLDRILNKVEIFKEEANKKTHSTYHLLRGPKELNEANVPDILFMIQKLEKNIQS